MARPAILRAVAAIAVGGIALAGVARGGESYPVADVPSGDRVVLRFGTLPIGLGLAHVQLPDDAPGRDAAKRRLEALVKGQTVQLVHSPAFGTDDGGSALVHIVAGTNDVAQTLVAEGLARFRAGGQASTFDRQMQAAEEQAKKAGKGVWAGGASVAAAARPAPGPGAAMSSATRPKGAFASELNSRFYYPAEHRAIANVNPDRLIYYRDEASAKKAGKQPAPAERGPVEVSASAAEAAFKKGEAIYGEAQSKGNSDARDQLYEQAFRQLTEAMQLYSQLCDQHPDDEALAEKARRCNQLRYGAMKQRRPH